MPAVAVKHCGLGVPLGDLIGLPLAPQAGKGARQLDPEWCGDNDCCARQQRLGQLQPGDVGMMGIQPPDNSLPLGLEAQAVDIAPILGRGIVEVQVAVLPLLLGEGGLIIAVGIGPEVEVEAVQRLRRVVAVADFELPVQEVLLVVEQHRDAIIDILLEIRLLCLALGIGEEP